MNEENMIRMSKITWIKILNENFFFMRLL